MQFTEPLPPVRFTSQFCAPLALVRNPFRKTESLLNILIDSNGGFSLIPVRSYPKINYIFFHFLTNTSLILSEFIHFNNIELQDHYFIWPISFVSSRRSSSVCMGGQLSGCVGMINEEITKDPPRDATTPLGSDPP